MTDSRRTRDFTISATWVLIIVIPIVAIALWVAIDHANENRDRVQARTNKQFATALIVTDRKFREALRITNAQTAYSINKSVCGFRAYVGSQLKSYQAAANDPSLSASARARNDERIRTTRQFLDTQVTVPSTFDCRTLPKNAPKATP